MQTGTTLWKIVWRLLKKLKLKLTYDTAILLLGINANCNCNCKSLQLCPTLWDPTDGSPPGSPIPRILKARTLEWGAVSFSNAWKWKVKVKSLSRVRLPATSWTAAHQAPPSMGFSRQEYWSGVPLPSPINAKETKILIWKDTCTPIFKQHCLQLPRYRSNPKCPLTNEWINKMWYIHIRWNTTQP